LGHIENREIAHGELHTLIVLEAARQCSSELRRHQRLPDDFQDADPARAGAPK
jgi:hypothetical protein